MKHTENAVTCNRIKRNRVLFIFIDGLGIGVPDPDRNPLARIDASILKSFSGSVPILPEGGIPLRNDPRMGIPGLPQSATGQSALFTGVNTAEAVGRHLSGFPNTILRKIISEQSLLKKTEAMGLKASFANTYTESYLKKIYPGLSNGTRETTSITDAWSGPGKKSVTTVMNETAGLRFRTEADLLEKNGLHMDFSNRFLRAGGLNIPQRTTREAAEILVGFARCFDLCLYEFFFSDLVGHRGNMDEAVTLLEELDSFLFHVVSLLDFDESSLMVTSDHGNIEDMSTRQHTDNLVPLLLWGKISSEFSGLPDPVPIVQITPTVLRHLSGRICDTHHF